MDGWEIDGVRKHTYNLELACKLMGEAEEEAPLLPYFPHFRRLLRRAESFLLPSPCPVYTLAISYTEGPGRVKATFGEESWWRQRVHGQVLRAEGGWLGLCWLGPEPTPA